MILRYSEPLSQVLKLGMSQLISYFPLIFSFSPVHTLLVLWLQRPSSRLKWKGHLEQKTKVKWNAVLRMMVMSRRYSVRLPLEIRIFI